MRRLPEVRRLIDQKGYFVVHAPRQVGKTTALLALARDLTAEGRYVSALVSMEVGAAFPHDIGAAELRDARDWRHAAGPAPARAATAPLPGGARGQPYRLRPHGLGRAPLPVRSSSSWMRSTRSATACWCPCCASCAPATATAPSTSPGRWSSSGCGTCATTRWLRRARPPGHRQPVQHQGGVAHSARLHRREVAELYAQHTADTGQRFEPEALAVACELTQGQPWLVNALAKVVEDLVPDAAQPITASTSSAPGGCSSSAGRPTWTAWPSACASPGAAHPGADARRDVLGGSARG